MKAILKVILKYTVTLSTIYIVVIGSKVTQCFATNINGTYLAESEYVQVDGNESYPVIIESGTQAILNSIVQKSKTAHIRNKPIGDIIQWTSLQLLNSPYVYYLLDKTTPEYLYISLSKTDCVLFTEEVVVISRLIKENKLTLFNYINGIKQLRYHGKLAYCNRNHYFKDWVIMNEKQGIVIDAGSRLTKTKLPFKSDIMSTLIEQNESNIHYSNLSCIRDREKIVNFETVGFITLKELPKYLKDIHPGDIIGIIRAPDKSDAVHHLAIAYVHNGEVGIIHASSIASKVVIYPSLMGYLEKFKDSLGIVLIRVQ